MVNLKRKGSKIIGTEHLKGNGLCCCHVMNGETEAESLGNLCSSLTEALQSPGWKSQCLLLPRLVSS